MNSTRTLLLLSNRCRYLDSGNVLRLPASGAFGQVDLSNLRLIAFVQEADGGGVIGVSRLRVPVENRVGAR
jgi:hypothetical protein